MRLELGVKSVFGFFCVIPWLSDLHKSLYYSPFKLLVSEIRGLVASHCPFHSYRLPLLPGESFAIGVLGLYFFHPGF